MLTVQLGAIGDERALELRRSSCPLRAGSCSGCAPRAGQRLCSQPPATERQPHSNRLDTTLYERARLLVRVCALLQTVFSQWTCLRKRYQQPATTGRFIVLGPRGLLQPCQSAQSRWAAGFLVFAHTDRTSKVATTWCRHFLTKTNADL